MSNRDERAATFMRLIAGQEMRRKATERELHRVRTGWVSGSLKMNATERRRHLIAQAEDSLKRSDEAIRALQWALSAWLMHHAPPTAARGEA